ncbi:MAG: LolA family protein [Gemmatimonadaceae bacterium]
MPTAKRSLIACSLIATTIGACSYPPPATTAAPVRSGRDVLAAMQQAYANKWYKTLTFVQRTTITRPDGTQQVSTWYEALQSPDRLRIDIGDPKLGNGVLYTADSLYAVRGGAITRKIADGNVFLPFVAGVYTQPLDTTLRQLAPYHFDLTRVREDRWQNRPVYVVGAADSADVSSPQFWIDRERQVAMRVIVPLGAAPNATLFDIHLDGYVPVAGGWLATRVALLSGGIARQTEEYSDWKGDVPLSPDLFVAERWSTAPHWVKN